jgi:OOP family OmpA-OmpF porin
MKLRSALLAATVLALPVAAKAQPVNGVYVGLGLGYNILQDVTTSLDSSLNVPSGKVQFDGGFVGLGSVGYGFGNGLRVELEGNYRDNKATKLTGGSYQVSAGGWEQKYGVMVNALYDFDVGAKWIYPYIGAGVGYNWTNLQNFRAYGNNGNFGGSQLSASGTQGAFAYQAILGAAFPIDAIPGLSLTAEYRFMGLAGDRKFDGSAVTSTGYHTGQVKLSQDYNHSFLLGVRYNFGVAPPPVAPVAAPVAQPARSYLVFFDWDKATLTDRARQIIAEAAANVAKVQHTSIEVNGYTDTSGSAKYNMGLSIRRAQAVAAELVRLGVPKQEIAIQGFGETHLLVPTGPNVREPQNRRVEIIIK